MHRQMYSGTDGRPNDQKTLASCHLLLVTEANKRKYMNSNWQRTYWAAMCKAVLSS